MLLWHCPTAKKDAILNLLRSATWDKSLQNYKENANVFPGHRVAKTYQPAGAAVLYYTSWWDIGGMKSEMSGIHPNIDHPKSRPSISFHIVSRLSGNYPDCPETFNTVWKFFRLSRIFQTVRKLLSLSGNSPDCLETFQTVLKLSRLSWNCPDSLETFHTLQLMFRLNFMGNIVNTRKNFPDAQKLSV